MSRAVRKDERKALLVYLKAEVIRDLKLKSYKDDVHVYEIVEDVLKASGYGGSKPKE